MSMSHDVARDDAVGGFDRRPLLRLGLLAGAHLQAALPVLLEQRRQTVEVVCAPGPPHVRGGSRRPRARRSSAASAASTGTGRSPGRGPARRTRRQPQPVGEAAEHAHGQLPAARLRTRACVPGNRERVVGPQSVHVRAGQLVRLASGRACRSTDGPNIDSHPELEALFSPCRALISLGQREEPPASVNAPSTTGGFDAVVDELEEADVGGGGPLALGDLRSCGPRSR